MVMPATRNGIGSLFWSCSPRAVASEACFGHVRHAQWHRKAFGEDFMIVNRYTPNKSPEPTAVGAISSAVAVPVASRRWLSFFR